MRISEPPSKPVEIEFEGKCLEAYEGEPIAIGLLANSIRWTSISSKGRRRGAFNIGPAPVSVNGRKRIDSRTTPIKPGMKIKRGHYLDFDLEPEQIEVKRSTAYYEVLIIGGGPAGLGALSELNGVVNVALVEKNGFLGGRARLREDERLDKWIPRDAKVYLKSTALGVFDRGEYLFVPVVSGNELIEVYAKRVILATGSVEATMLFENNDHPSIFGLSRALDAIVNRRVKPGETVAVVGREPEFVKPILEKYGIEVVQFESIKGVYDSDNGVVVRDFEGNDAEVDAVIVSDGRRPDINPTTQPGGRIEFVHGYFAPVVDERMRISRGIYVAGSAYRIWEDHETSYIHGRLVASFVLEDLGYEAHPEKYAGIAGRFKEYTLRNIPLDRLDAENTFICGCDVTLADVRRVIQRGITELQIIKRLTHTAMGFCQGRYCLFNTAALVSQVSGKSMNELDIPVARPPLRPTKMGILGVE